MEVICGKVKGAYNRISTNFMKVNDPKETKNVMLLCTADIAVIFRMLFMRAIPLWLL